MSKDIMVKYEFTLLEAFTLKELVRKSIVECQEYKNVFSDPKLQNEFQDMIDKRLKLLEKIVVGTG